MSHPGLVTNKHLQNKKRGKTKKKKKKRQDKTIQNTHKKAEETI